MRTIERENRPGNPRREQPHAIPAEPGQGTDSPLAHRPDGRGHPRADESGEDGERTEEWDGEGFALGHGQS